MNSSLRINELRLRAPGLTRDQGRQLGDAVTQRLLNLNVKQSRTFSALKVSIPSGTSISIECMADRIVQSIRRSLA